MLTTSELIEIAHKSTNNYTVAGLSRILKSRPDGYHKWKTGKPMNDRAALIICEITRLDADYVLFSLAAERSKMRGYEECFKFWKGKADAREKLILKKSGVKKITDTIDVDHKALFNYSEVKYVRVS